MDDNDTTPEYIAEKLKEWGCEYSQDDPRSAVWLQGFKVGVNKGADIGLECLERLGSRL